MTAAVFRQPAEWERHDFVWIGFPHDGEEWPGLLDGARRDVAAFANAVQRSGEQVRLVVRDAENADIAAQLVDSGVTLHIHKFGDIWLRDTGPLILSDGTAKVARHFGFNGWGGKYAMAGDTEIGAALARDSGLVTHASDWIFEGGAIDNDGTGLAVTTEQCLLNPNRNPHLSRADVEARLRTDLGIDRLLWLGEGLVNDHTDGHVDNLARFIGPGWIAIPEPEGRDDPNAHIFADARERAESFGLSVAAAPSPGRVERDGAVIPASYMNFYIANDAVIVPLYDRPNDARAVAFFESVFSDKGCIGVPALSLIGGGGSFHCCSQQMPVLTA